MFLQKGKKDTELISMLGSNKPELKQHLETVINEISQAQDKLHTITNMVGQIKS